MVGDTLVALDYDLKTVKPGLAKSWSVSEDGKTYTFNLKEGVKFCSGKEFTAQDVVDNINRWRDPATKGVVTWRAGPVKEVRAKDKLTVEYELTKPYSELLFQMTQHFHTIINVDQAKELGDDFGVKALDATGPFCFQSWEPRNQGTRCDYNPEDQRYPEVGQCVHSIVMAPGMPDRLYQQNHCGMYRSDDGGKQWSSIEAGLPSTFGFPAAVHPRDPDTFYLLPLNGDSAGRFVPDAKAAVWRTRDGGKTWRDLREGLPQETLSLKYAAVQWKYTQQKIGGGQGGSSQGAWSLTKNDKTLAV